MQPSLQQGMKGIYRFHNCDLTPSLLPTNPPLVLSVNHPGLEVIVIAYERGFSHPKDSWIAWETSDVLQKLFSSLLV